MNTDEWANVIALIEIVVTAGLGIWLATAVQRRMDQGQAIRQYFTDEIKDINVAYREFLLSVMSGKSSAKYIKDWFKHNGIRLKDIENRANDLGLITDAKMVARHCKLQQYITSTDEMQQMYNDDAVKFQPKVKYKINQLQATLQQHITKAIVEINTTKDDKLTIKIKDLWKYFIANIWGILAVLLLIGLIVIASVTMSNLIQLVAKL